MRRTGCRPTRARETFEPVLLTADDELAFSHSVNRLSGTEKNGKKMDMWFRATVCFRKNNGRWLVTHEHASVPFYPDASMKAATDLKP